MGPETAIAWNGIEKWYSANVPDTPVLPGPASAEEVSNVEKLLGIRIPVDLKESYLLHNGTGEFGVFPYGYFLHSLAQVVKEWTFWRDALKRGAFATMEAIPIGSIKTVWWNEKWIPITGNGGGDHDCVDMDPTSDGNVGQIIEFSHETGPRRVAAQSFSEWLAEFFSESQRRKV